MKELILPLKEAIEAAARQNYERDVRSGQFEDSTSWERESDYYLEEAEWVLLDSGENYLPDYDDHPHIKVLK